MPCVAVARQGLRHGPWNGFRHGSDRRAEQVVGVGDVVAVTLLGQEALPVCGVVGVQVVAGDNLVEHRAATVVLGPQQPAEALSLFLA